MLRRCNKGDDLMSRETQKSDYLSKLATLDNDALYSECYSMIYQSARCANNPRADWHWMVDSCYDEAKRRDENANIYARAFEECYRDHAR